MKKKKKVAWFLSSKSTSEPQSRHWCLALLISLFLRCSSLFLLLLSEYRNWVCKAWFQFDRKTSLMDSSLAFQNRAYYTWNVKFLNSFENVLTNEIVWKSMLFWGKKKPPAQELTPYQFQLISKQNKGSFLLRRGRS